MADTISRLTSESESESEADGTVAHRHAPPAAAAATTATRQRIDNVDTLLNHIRQQSKGNLARRASALPEMRGRSSGFVDQLGKYTHVSGTAINSKRSSA